MTTKTARLEARLSPENQTLIQHAAALQGLSVTEFVVAASLAEAQKAIHQHERLSLSVAEQRRFADVLLKAAKPNAAMKRAAKSHQQLIEPS